MPKSITHGQRHSERLRSNQIIPINEVMLDKSRKKVVKSHGSPKRRMIFDAENDLSVTLADSSKNDEVVNEKRRRTRSFGSATGADVNSAISVFIGKRKPLSADREATKSARNGKSETESSDYSPIKTRGFVKNKARVKDRCRICKSDGEPFISCIDCGSDFHLNCLGYSLESSNSVYEKRKLDWQCPMCVLCAKCYSYVHDAENVQCFLCDRAYHGTCRPDPNVNYDACFLQPWFCSDCKVEPSSSKVTLLDTNTKRGVGRKKRSFQRLRLVGSWSDTNEESKIQKKRDELNDSLKDECKSRILKDKRRVLDLRERRFGQENRSPKKSPLKRRTNASDSATFFTKMAELSCEVKIVDGVKVKCFSDEEIEAVKVADKEAAEITMKRLSIPFDYTLYTTAKKTAEETEEVDASLTGKVASPQIVHYGNELEFEALHKSRYPKLLSESPHLYVCRFCLIASENNVKYKNHLLCCQWQYPPGNEIYRDGALSFWEIDGELEKSYCQRLCLFAKLFLSSKTLHREVEMFLFYLLTKHTTEGCVILGYFSKEKNPCKNNNLSCLLTLPFSLRCGYGRFLIDLSYKLSLRERKVGGPEHPLSDLGLVTYRGYWKAVIFSYIRERRPLINFSLKDMTYDTGIHPQDIVSTLRHCKMLSYREGTYYIDAKKAYMAPLKAIRRRVIKDKDLIWEPEFEVDNEKMGNYASNKPLF